MALKTTIRKQGDVLTEHISGSESEFQINTTHFINKNFSVIDCCLELKNPLRGNVFPKSIYVLGHTRPGDGGEGNFYWNSRCDFDGDDRNIIQVNGINTGRWLRILQGTYNYMFNVQTILPNVICTITQKDVILTNTKLIMKHPFDDINSTVEFYIKSNNNKIVLLQNNESILTSSNQFHYDISIQLQEKDQLMLNLNRCNSTVGCGVFTYSFSSL